MRGGGCEGKAVSYAADRRDDSCLGVAHLDATPATPAGAISSATCSAHAGLSGESNDHKARLLA